MAYVINPDGTITTVEADYDRYGNLKPKINSELLNEQVIHYKSNTAPDTKTVVGKRSASKKKKNKTTSPSQVNKVVEANQTFRKQDAIKRKKIRIITRQSIEKYFIKKRNLHQIVTHEDIMRASIVLKSSLLNYFMEKYEQYKEYCLSMGWGAKIPLIKKVKKKKKKSKKKNKEGIISTKNISSNPSCNTIGEIAKFSTMKDSMKDSDIIYKRNGPSRPPKYGYARDYFGRVQERNSFNEDKKNEFKQSQKSQSKYDYSSYDAEDDHDSYYDYGGYE